MRPPPTPPKEGRKPPPTPPKEGSLERETDEHLHTKVHFRGFRG